MMSEEKTYVWRGFAMQLFTRSGLRGKAGDFLASGWFWELGAEKCPLAAD